MSSISLKPNVLVENPTELKVEEGHFSKTMMYMTVGFLACLFISPLFSEPSWFALIFVLSAVFFLVLIPLGVVLIFCGYREVTIRPGEYLECVYYRDLGGKKVNRIPWSELKSVSCTYSPSIESNRDRSGSCWTESSMMIYACRVDAEPFVVLRTACDPVVVDKVARYAGEKYSLRTERSLIESLGRIISRYFDRLAGDGGRRKK